MTELPGPIELMLEEDEIKGREGGDETERKSMCSKMMDQIRGLVWIHISVKTPKVREMMTLPSVRGCESPSTGPSPSDILDNFKVLQGNRSRSLVIHGSPVPYFSTFKGPGGENAYTYQKKSVP